MLMTQKTKLQNYLKEILPNEWEQRKSIEAWLLRYLSTWDIGNAIKLQLQHIVEQGCSSGCVGEVIYYHDVLAFYRKFETQIWETVFSFIESTGETLGQFIDSTKLSVADETHFKNFLVWFVIETKAQAMLDYLDEKEG